LDAGLISIVFSMGICHGVGFSLTYGQAIGAVMKVSSKAATGRLLMA